MRSKKQYNGYNGNQFYWNEIDFVRQHLVTLFDVPANKMLVQNMEFGQNLTTSFDPKDFIKGLLFFEGRSFEYQFNDHFAKSVHTQYVLKIYNKSNQYEMPLNTLRFEVKTLKMQFQQKKIGIKTVADFSPTTMQRAFNFLEYLLNKVLYYDYTIRKKELSTKDKNHIKDLSNPRFWQNLKPNKRDGKKKLLQKIINNHSQNLKASLIKLLDENRVKFYRQSIS